MKILTLNTHSLAEKEYEKKLLICAEALAKEKPHIIALQEVNQTASEKAVSGTGIICGDIPVKADNHVYRLAEMLCDRGVFYHWSWLGIKRGYDRYDEGLAVMSLSEIEKTESVLLSRADNYTDWKTRKALGIKTEGVWFYSVHTGWWNDTDEPFSEQWKRLSAHMEKHSDVWLMGDFNAPAHIRGESCELIKNSGWYDSFELALTKDSGITVEKAIDGWEGSNSGMRIDYIWSRKRAEILSSEVIFNGRNYPVVSDHYGVMLEIK